MKKTIRQGTIAIRVIVLLFIVLSINDSIAQDRVIITGRVTNNVGAPLPGVSVFIKDSSVGASTDSDGNYRIEANQQSILQFTQIGLKFHEEVVGSRTVINVVLEDDNEELAEVVVIGYGQQKKANLTGAVVTLESEELVRRPVPNTSLLLQGKVPGLQVVQNSAQPGMENASLQVRGQGTFSAAGNNPLIIVDGVQGSLTSLNPNMIESVTVLKDAASAAIYGVQGANGVILVTTKSGSKGKMKLEYAYNYGVQKPAGVPDLIWNSVE